VTGFLSTSSVTRVRAAPEAGRGPGSLAPFAFYRRGSWPHGAAENAAEYTTPRGTRHAAVRVMYGDGYMVTKRVVRTIRCAYCGEVRTLPSARGPAPKYCSPAHRQGAYRQRRRDEGLAVGEPAPRPSLREEVEALQGALRKASTAKSWSEARQLLGDGLAHPEPSVSDARRPRPAGRRTSSTYTPRQPATVREAAP